MIRKQNKRWPNSVGFIWRLKSLNSQLHPAHSAIGYVAPNAAQGVIKPFSLIRDEKA